MDFKSNSVFDCTLVEINTIKDLSGVITIVENEPSTPFEVKRIYYLYDVPGGQKRGEHAHKELQQFVFAARGSFEVVLDDNLNKRRFVLNKPNLALHIVPGIWRCLDNFSTGSVCMVLASHIYDEGDYIRNYQEFQILKKRG